MSAAPNVPPAAPNVPSAAPNVPNILRPARRAPGGRPFQAGPENPRWNSGRTITDDGYVRLKTGPYRDWLEHRAVAHWLLTHNTISPDVTSPELLATCDVHHMDRNRTHNCPHNLLVLPPAFHHPGQRRHAHNNNHRATPKVPA